MKNDIFLTLFSFFGSPLVATIHDVLSDRRIDEVLSTAADRLEEPKTISSSDARIKNSPASRTGKVCSDKESAVN